MPRNALPQRHLDLKNLFHEKVRAHGDIPDGERRLRREVARLKRLREDDTEKFRQLRNDNEALVRALNLSQLENEQLRQKPANLGSNVRVLGEQSGRTLTGP
ncbi:hypothetical protein [Arthrobacter sp. ISL-28]|uniref:hypothetical protein n=1 Tax=Arthrobacter sp. ISL-28 TaxID=2819108 RepID=UPI001BEC6C44|nr:hypothetical protein [Arthrobacter sp. ISL-28]MBT2523754.1 hypothetical protein [Arthrobacter sp. ISL-28]